MFARHTHARRMKKTGVVQGLKSLADKIHPNGNAPLTTNESKRLLTALTSSFRRHLDAAYPISIEDDRKKRSEANVQPAQVNNSGIYSSAVFAQKHMASVLTNPLLVRGAKGYGSAKVELQKNPYRDPIELLEEYEREGAASVRVAELCMENVKKEYDAVPEARKTQLLEELQPGRRVFIWLLESGKYSSADYADNVQFIELLTFFLVRQGCEEKIWQWLKLDVQAPDSPEGPPKNTHQSVTRRMLYKYRWRGRLLVQFMSTQIGVPWRADHSGKAYMLRATSLESALDTFFTALDLHTSALAAGHRPEQWHHLAWLPLGAAATYLVKLLTRRLRTSNARGGDVELQKGDTLNAQLFNKLIDSVPLAFEVGASAKEGIEPRQSYKMTDAATLHLIHPIKPSADPMLKILHVLFPDNTAEGLSRFYEHLARNDDSRFVWHLRMVKSAHLLMTQGRHEEAKWVRARIPLYFPELDHYTESDEHQYSIDAAYKPATQVDEVRAPTHVPFPSFT